MPFTIEPLGAVAKLVVFGQWGLAEALAAQSETGELVRDEELVGVLVDLREAEVVGPMLGFFEVTAGHATTFPPGTRHAVVVNESISEQEWDFADTVATNRCVFMRRFDDPETALAWLLERED